MITVNPVAHSPTSRLLRQDHPQSMRSLVRMFGLPGFWTVVGELRSSIKTGEPSAERALPGGIWGYLAQNPEASRILGEAMTAKAHGHIAGIVNTYDFSRFESASARGRRLLQRSTSRCRRLHPDGSDSRLG
jgi:hypothetical protein